MQIGHATAMRLVLGEMHHQNLMVRIPHYAHQEYKDTLAAFGVSLPSFPFDPCIHQTPVDSIYEALSSMTFEEAYRHFRVYQVFRHETAHYRHSCSTTAGLVTFLLSADQIGMARGLLAQLLPEVFVPECPKGFIPILGIPSRPSQFSEKVLSAARFVQQFLYSCSNAGAFWAAPPESAQSFGMTPTQFMAHLDELERVLLQGLVELPSVQVISEFSPRHGLTVENLFEGLATLYDIRDISLIDRGRTALLAARLYGEIAFSGGTYNAVMNYCDRVWKQHRPFDMMLALDLALMTPIFNRIGAMYREGLKWEDLHPVLRFYKIVDELAWRVPLTPGSDFDTDYEQCADSICRALDWPLLRDICASVTIKPPFDVEHYGGIRVEVMTKFSHAMRLRRESQLSVAHPSFGPIEVRNEVIKLVRPSIQFWADGMAIGTIIDPCVYFDILAHLLTESLVTDCLSAISIDRTRKMVSDIAVTIERGRKQGIAQAILCEDAAPFDVLGWFEVVCQNTFRVHLNSLKALSFGNSE
jgi:hypothetical protein